MVVATDSPNSRLGTPHLKLAPLGTAAVLAVALGIHCTSPPSATSSKSARAAASAGPEPLSGEAHFADLRQLTFGGENAEAYFSFGGRELVLQAKAPGAGCDRIYRLSLDDPSRRLVPVSSGKGATTCSYFMPGDREIIFSSTELSGAECPPVPDRSQGYVWPLHEHDIFKVQRDGSGSVRLTESKGYDAEATVCGKDGSIVFTSVRDGDLELYRMDADGKNVRRLTNSPGYDGGAFFSPDCTKIVWRASRPRNEDELRDYRALLAKGLVRPTKLELYVARGDGSEATQITYLDAASFGPYWHPSGRRIVFATNYGDPKGREFDIWAIDETGANLERITHAPGFDGFPMFSHDGKLFAFASNRATAPGAHDTNVFVARWVDPPQPRPALVAADRVFADVSFLADPAREGRGIGTQGLTRAGEYLEQRFAALGLAPAGDPGSFRQAFPVTTSLAVGAGSRLRLGEAVIASGDWIPLGFSLAAGNVQGELVLVGYGIVKPGGRDDYARKVVKNKIAVVRRFVPDEPEFASTADKRRFGDLRYKAWLAKQRGAKGLIVIDEPARPPGAAKDWQAPKEASLPALVPEGYSDSGILAAALERSVGAPLVARLARGERVQAELSVELTAQRNGAFNVVGRIAAQPQAGSLLPGTIVIGAHYDHLGYGGPHSLAHGEKAPHVGADDNASGTAALLEIARVLAAPESRRTLRRHVVLAAFSGEESGLLGSAHFVHAGEANAPGALSPKDVFAMVNLDMVGRLRENRLAIFGTETAPEWQELVLPACGTARIACSLAGDGGYGPSDQMSFYVAGVPVLHLFTGSHSDYHKPSDTPDKVNAAGAAQIAKLSASLATGLAQREKPLSYVGDAGSATPRGDVRSFNASLGTIPDYAGPGAGKSGVLFGGVRPGGAAEKAGLRRGDVLVRLGRHEIRSVEDFTFVLNESKPGETVKAAVLRDGKELEVTVTFQDSQRPR